MEAVVCHDFGESSVEDVPRPEPDPAEVLVSVDRVQLSVTECQLYRGQGLSTHAAVRDRLATGDGRLFGHEFCGEVVEVDAAVVGDQSHGTTGDDPLAVAGRTVRAAGTVVQVGIIIGEIALESRAFRLKSIRWVNPRLDVTSTGPNTDTCGLAPQLIADETVDIGSFITQELSELGSFEEAVEITLEEPAYDALGRARIVV